MGSVLNIYKICKNIYCQINYQFSTSNFQLVFLLKCECPGLARLDSPVPAEATNARPALDLANLPVAAIIKDIPPQLQ
jgi:hypothetical protein